MTVECPADGCEYTGERGQVIAHASSKVGEPHKGLGGQQVANMLDVSEPDSGDEDQSDSTEDGEEGLGVPESENTDASGNAETCPDCDGALDDLEPGGQLRGEYDGDTVVVETEEGDLWCPECDLAVCVDGEVIR